MYVRKTNFFQFPEHSSLAEAMEKFKQEQGLVSVQVVLSKDGLFDAQIHPQGGVIVQAENKLYLNGVKLLYEGEIERWEPYAQGVIIRTKQQLLRVSLDGTIQVLSENCRCDCYIWSQGLVIVEEEQLVLVSLDGTIQLTYKTSPESGYEPTFSGYIHTGCEGGELGIYPQGVVINVDSAGLLLLSLDGTTTVLYKGDSEDCTFLPQGIVVREEDQLLLVLLDGTTQELYGGFDEYQVSPQGVVIEDRQKLLRVSWDGTITKLCKGEFYEWQPHPQGVVTHEGDKLLLNGTQVLCKAHVIERWEVDLQGNLVIAQGEELFLLSLDGRTSLLYKGNFRDWNLCPQGVIIRVNDERILLPYVSFAEQ